LTCCTSAKSVAEAIALIVSPAWPGAHAMRPRDPLGEQEL
jgi:hypothetical protein